MFHGCYVLNIDAAPCSLCADHLNQNWVAPCLGFRFRGKVKEIHDVVAVIGKYAQNGPKSRWTMFLQFKIHNSRRQLPMKLVAP
jgi:hypothetical protein